ncbi:hypothetical protein Btru_069749 [Bulinus truncatus]|nr:hypothetical protein Btru_069749 [Bulinus truncatus]
MSDGDTDLDCGNKRLAKSVNRTLDFLDEIVEAKRKSVKKLKSDWCNRRGFSEKERKRSAVETAARPVEGFLIEGFEKGHSGVDLFSIQDFTKTLSCTLEHLPVDKLRFMETVWSPLQQDKGNVGFHIDLNNPKYAEDFTALLPGCSCYTCSNFTRSYIHHLLNTKELLAYVLLTMHNFHQYFEILPSSEAGHQR